MPSASDWRSASTADRLMQLNQDQLAVEFLRRNPEYNEDSRATQNRIAAGDVSHAAGMAGLARRWGLSFPACTRHACMGFTCIMETGTFTRLCHRCRST